jgi:hypothetical protein
MRAHDEEVKSFTDETPQRLAADFQVATLSTCALRALQEQHWLLEPFQYDEFLQQVLARELSPLAGEYRRLLQAQWKVLNREAEARLSAVVTEVRALPDGAFRKFLQVAVPALANLIRRDPLAYLANSLYRAFDSLDEIFGLDFELDRGLKVDTSERIYAGSGLGVQTSYSTLLLVLEQLRLGQHFIDLGSGYGRVGLILGLLHPEVHFSGYEYVDHRVEVSRRSAARAGISDHVRFYTQDLAALDFEIPTADVYYLYDPFTRPTYRLVFAQLKRIARERPITIAAKGDGAEWFRDEIRGETNWRQEAARDVATLHVFSASP